MKNEKMRKWRNRLGKAAWMLSAAICIGIVGSSAAARAEEGDVMIDETNFPDENFREYVKQFDVNGDGILFPSEKGSVGSIFLKRLGISNLEGIKNFPNLYSLSCSSESLQKLDLSGMAKLTFVTFKDNKNLTEVNLEGCEALEEMTCNDNGLTEMNLAGCKALEKLLCNDNELIEMNLAGCRALEYLQCSGNRLQKLDVSGKERLKYFYCNGNELQELNVIGCTSLEDFNCDSNHLKKIDVTGCTSLSDFDCRDNGLQELNLSNCEMLWSLECSYNELKELDLSNCEMLWSLECSYNELKELDITNCRELRFLSCEWNNLTELNVENRRTDVQAEGNYIDEEKDGGEYQKEWIVFPMKKYTYMGDFSKPVNMIPYIDLGVNLYKEFPYDTIRIVAGSFIKGGQMVTNAEGMTYSNEAEAFYVEPFEKEKTVSFTLCKEDSTGPGNKVEMRLVNMNFEDIRTKDWFFEPVAYVNENALMTGMNETMFAPADTLARAQFAVILHRMNGKPAMEYTERFPDVEKGIWYTDAILWASQAKVVNGYSSNGYFGPADKITREQMAAMMYRYADFKGYDTSARKELDTFKDAAKVNAYALDAMQWAVGNEIITGKTIDGQLVLDPEGYANRAECAAIIMRFTEKYEK